MAKLRVSVVDNGASVPAVSSGVPLAVWLAASLWVDRALRSKGDSLPTHSDSRLAYEYKLITVTWPVTCDDGKPEEIIRVMTNVGG